MLAVTLGQTVYSRVAAHRCTAGARCSSTHSDTAAVGSRPPPGRQLQPPGPHSCQLVPSSQYLAWLKMANGKYVGISFPASAGVFVSESQEIELIQGSFHYCPKKPALIQTLCSAFQREPNLQYCSIAGAVRVNLQSFTDILQVTQLWHNIHHTQRFFRWVHFKPFARSRCLHN